MYIQNQFCKIFICSICFFVENNCKAQTHFNLNAGISYSVNKNIIKEYYSPSNGLTVIYNSYKRYDYPSILVNGDILFPVNKNLSIGFKSGLNIHTSEKYFTNVRRTVANVTAQGGINYQLLKSKNIICGINLFSGINIIFLTQDDIKVNPGPIHTANFFLNWKRNTINIGLEKEIQNIKYYYIAMNPYQKNETVKFKENKILMFLTYGFRLK